MTIKHTKILESALAIGTFASAKAGGGSPIDRALLFLIDDGENHAYHILSRILKGWEIEQIKTRIKEELAESVANAEGAVVDHDFYFELSSALEKICGEFTLPDEPMINTGHLLMYVMRNRQFVSSRVLAMYNITPENIFDMVGDMPACEDYYAEMNALRNVQILRVNNTLSQQNMSSGEEDDDSDDEDYADSSDPKIQGIEKYGVDLTKAARDGKIDPVIGRDKEIERVIQILGRRKKNNPIIIGEAGVGKSAIVEGLALRIVAGETPPALYGKKVFSLDITSLVAGTKYRGQFEERIKAFMDELRKDNDVILFIDEIHTIVGAGSTQGSLDTANILKPALARGELQCIGATTLDEFRENIENDSALERRFQKVVVEPTTKDETREILLHLKEHYEKHHSVSYSDEAIAACVELTDRYVTDRHFPDKAIDVLDEAGSKATLMSPPKPDISRHLEEELNRVREEKRRAAAALDYKETESARRREIELDEQIKKLKADENLCRTIITADHIREVVSTITGIPVSSVSDNEKSRLQGMAKHLNGAVVGQKNAISKITKSIQRSRAGLKDPSKPIGVFMFVGPTGVGKTLLAKELSKWMFSRPDALIRIDMSEYSEKHNISRLIGSPPGYVGYSEGGQLTEAVRRQPYSVILFDEIEKAHPEVFNVMLQLFDEGQLTDGTGRKVDFRNTVIIMTSNAGSRKVAARPPVIGYDTPDLECIDKEGTEADYREALEEVFAPEFVNRIDDILVFNTLSIEDVKQIVDIELSQLRNRALASGYTLRVTAAAKAELARLGHSSRYGVRSLKRIILENVEEPLAELIVNNDAVPGDIIAIELHNKKLTLTHTPHKTTATA